jgi:oxygen-independent coproporphyrinogen-3 oxidase
VVEAYLTALAEEISHRARNLPLQTLYLGGGTPTSLTLPELSALHECLRPLDLTQVDEFSTEANPGTLTIEKLMLLREMGCNRISLGVQTFHEGGLKILGRAHSAKQARLAVSLCQEAGFENLSIDLINGWPGQTLANWHDDLDRAADLGATHLSCYGLTYEEGTELFRRRERLQLHPLGESMERKLFDLTAPCLERLGFTHYEISSYARPGYTCLHNRTYWEGGEYCGLGAAAHSYERGIRSSNCDDPLEYIQRISEAGTARVWQEELPPERCARERAVFWLRLLEGVHRQQFHSESGFRLEELFADALPPLLDAGWLELTADHLRLSPAGLPVADSILAELI